MLNTHPIWQKAPIFELAERLVSLQAADGSWVDADSKDWWEDRPDPVTSWAPQALEHAMK